MNIFKRLEISKKKNNNKKAIFNGKKETRVQVYNNARTQSLTICIDALFLDPFLTHVPNGGCV